jgi:tRNA(Arg) A34 adenosine deaminase TadA
MLNHRKSKYNKYIPNFIEDACSEYKTTQMRVLVMSYMVSKHDIIGPFLNGPTTNPKINACSMHAERMCMKKVLKIKKKLNPYGKCYSDGKKTNYEIIVVRIDRNKLIKSGRPCKDCLSVMKSYGIKKCHYTTDSGIIIVENVDDMISIHRSFVALKHFKTKYTKSWVSRETHFKKLLIKDVPSIMKEYNFMMLVKHNLENVLPSLKYNIKKNIVHIMDDSENILCKVQLL